MASELETAAATSIGAVNSATLADLSGQPCRNCTTPVAGRYCPKCGQLAASFHRPFWTLIGETITDATAIDGRLARTLPLLLLRPGRLTREYTSGKRARFVPPFRLLLLSSVLFYLCLFSLVSQTGLIDGFKVAANEGSGVIVVDGKTGVSTTIIDADGKVDRQAARRLVETPENGAASADAIVNIVADTIENPEAFRAELQAWTPRLSIILVPLTILMLAFLHAFRRKLYVYDHAVHALHLHSWIYLTGTGVIVLVPYIGGALGWIAPIAVIAYVWRSLAVTAGTGMIMSAIRLVFLLVFWLIAVLGLVLCAIILSSLSVSA